jgi:4-aminobutyrate aminotransferase/diaminobutyrate-pyruvate transaminase/4-aminobutyrate aminotransferase/(S)-3-amino-2-methylpropionate transaminase
MYKLFNSISKKIKPIHTKYRDVSYLLPIEYQEYFNRLEKYQPKSNDFLPRIIWDRAEGFQVYSGDNKFLDFTSGIFVANCGHGNPQIVSAIQKASEEILHTYIYPNKYSIELAEILVNMVKQPNRINKALLLSTGSEANEIAIKLCKVFGMKKNPDKKIIISFDRAFHGKSAFARLTGGNEKAHEWTGVKANDVGFYNFPYPTDYLQNLDVENSKFGEDLFEQYILDFSKKFDVNNIAGFFIEPYQGWSATFFPKGFIQRLRKFADDINALVVFDEIQAGMGRCGKLLSHEYYDVEADIITLGKGLTSGLPLSAVLARDELFGDDLSYTSTHCNNPVCCASAIANIKYLLENNLVEKSYIQGKWVKKELEKIQQKYPDRIRSIQGVGSVWGIIFTKPNTDEYDIEFVDRIVDKCCEKGLLIIKTMAGSIKLGYPLIIEDNALVEGLQVIEEAISELIAEGY